MKKIAIVFLSLFLVVSLPLAAHANIVTATGKYIINAIKHVPGGAKVDATNTVTGAKHVIKHGVSSQALGQGIGAGIIQFGVAGGLGLAFEAITGLALNAVDWVMDPANNQIKYKNKGTGSGSGSGGSFAEGIYTISDSRISASAADPVSVCKDYAAKHNAANGVDYYGTREFLSASASSCSTRFNGSIDLRPDKWQLTSWPISFKPSVSGSGSGSGSDTDSYKSIALNTLAQKTLDLADSGNATAQKDVEDYVMSLAKKGDLDLSLDKSTDITKPDDPTEPEKPKKECPVGTVRVGDICIALPDDLPNGEAQCGDCCAELIAILAEMAKMNELFYEKSLDNDAQSLAALNQINAEIAKLSLDFNLLLEQAKLTNQTLTQINDGQELHFNELKQKVDELKKSVEDGNALILLKLNDVEAAIKISNEKLDKVNENLEKINENLEKMQKCEGTELNQKLCEFMDWFKSEPSEAEDGKVDVKEIEAQNSNKINMSGECPAPYELNFEIFGYSQNNSISYAPLCSALTMLKPIFVGAGALSSMFILMGYNRPNGGN